MNFYHNQVTKKSWQELQKLSQQIRFVLIGGWAVYLYTQALKSKDIDILTDFKQLPILRKKFSLTKNERLKKYEAISGEVEIDVYLPYYSKLGLPSEELITQKSSLEGFDVLEINYLFVLKLHTLAQRGRSLKGRKDFIDLISLWRTKQCDPEKIVGVIKKYQLEADLKVFSQFVSENVDLEELDLSRHQYAKIKKELQTCLG